MYIYIYIYIYIYAQKRAGMLAYASAFIPNSKEPFRNHAHIKASFPINITDKEK